MPGCRRQDGQHGQAPEEDRVRVEEAAGQQAVSLRAEQCPPGWRPAGGWPAGATGPQDRPHGRLAEVVTEPGPLAVHPAVPPTTGSPALGAGPVRRSPGWYPGRPGRPGYLHLPVITRRCQASSVPGVTMRWRRSAAGTSRASAASTARPAPSGLGRVTWRRSTMISGRSTMIPASFGRPAAAQQEQPATDSDHDQAWKASRHKPRSCPRSTQSAKPQLTSLRPVVKRYRSIHRAIGVTAAST
jgi:hypothetical protein